MSVGIETDSIPKLLKGPQEEVSSKMLLAPSDRDPEQFCSKLCEIRHETPEQINDWKSAMSMCKCPDDQVAWQNIVVPQSLFDKIQPPTLDSVADTPPSSTASPKQSSRDCSAHPSSSIVSAENSTELAQAKATELSHTAQPTITINESNHLEIKSKVLPSLSSSVSSSSPPPVSSCSQLLLPTPDSNNPIDTDSNTLIESKTNNDIESKASTDYKVSNDVDYETLTLEEKIEIAENLPVPYPRAKGRIKMSTAWRISRLIAPKLDKPPSKIFYTWQEVEKHTKPDDCWLVVKNKVYDASIFMHYHCAGIRAILMYTGQDCTKAYRIHRGEGRKMWKLFEIGRIKPGSVPTSQWIDGKPPPKSSKCTIL